MTPDVRRNREFAKWFGEWTAAIQHSRVSVGQIPPEKTTSTDKQKHSALTLKAQPGDGVRDGQHSPAGLRLPLLEYLLQAAPIRFLVS